MAHYVPIGDLASVTQGLNASGSGAGARSGDWIVAVVDSANIQDDLLLIDGLRTVAIKQNVKTEKHLLAPNDVLLTARSTAIRSALVPPPVTRTVAGATLLVVRPLEPESGLGHYLWYFFTSVYGRGQLDARLNTSSTIASLSALSIEEMAVPLPDFRRLHQLANLIEESQRTYVASLEAARQRRDAVRDHIIHSLRKETRRTNAVNDR